MHKFTWSYTSLSTFLTCPFQYAAKYFYKSVKFQDTEASIWGNRVHAAAETKLKGGIPDDTVAYNEVSRYCDLFDKVRTETDCERLVEFEISVTDKWKTTKWFAPDAWGRAKIDLVQIAKDSASIYDWKTGNSFDPKQLSIFCLMLAIARPDLNYFIPRFIMLKTGKVIGLPDREGYFRKDLIPVARELNELINRVKEAWETECFPTKRNGLCRKWCDVKECQYCGG